MDAAVLNGLYTVCYLKQLARCDLKVRKWPIYLELHAATFLLRISISAPQKQRDLALGICVGIFMPAFHMAYFHAVQSRCWRQAWKSASVRVGSHAQQGIRPPQCKHPVRLSITHKSLTQFALRRLKFIESFESLVIHC
jgi:hypothetical protein